MLQGRRNAVLPFVVAFEGSSHSGKSTLCALTAEKFRKKGYSVAVLDTKHVPLAQELRALAKEAGPDKILRMASHWLLRLLQIQELRRRMADPTAQIILLDRYIGSTRVMDVGGNEMPQELFDNVLFRNAPRPNFTIIVDAPIKAIRQRSIVCGSYSPQTIKDDAFARRVWMEYQALAHLGNSILVQNYNKTPEQALEEFMPLLEGSAELFLSSRQRPRHKRRR